MTHHSNLLPDCPSCSLKLEQGHPLLRPYFLNIRLKFPECHLACTFRDQKAQEDAFKSGLSKKHWPNSKHNVMVKGVPQSRAFDFFKQENGLTKYPHAWVMEVITYCKSENYPFVYGVDFKDFSEDTIHIQLKDEIT